MFDILIRGGSVADGSRTPLFPADIGIERDRITAVEPLPGAAAAAGSLTLRVSSWRPGSSISTPTRTSRCWPTAEA